MPKTLYQQEPAWVTTGDAARMLHVTGEGVRWLARTKRLVGERAASGQWFFRPDDVMALLEQRAKARGGLVAVPPSTSPPGEPRQLALFVGWERKGTLRSRSETSTNTEETRASLITDLTLPCAAEARS